MSLIYQQDINANTRIAIWKIEEPLSFFLAKLQMNNIIPHPKKQLQHLAGRHLLQQLIPDFPLQQIIAPPASKPYLENNEYRFSISHSDDYVAAIVSTETIVGIDIELFGATAERVKHKFLSNEEIAAFNNQQLPLNNRHYVLFWCIKEAMYKYWGRAGVDFKTMLKIDFFKLNTQGEVPIQFIAEEKTLQTAYYKIFDKFCVVWI